MEQYTTPMTPEQQSHNKNAVTSMVLGIVSLVITWLPLIGLVLAIIGLTMSSSNRKFAATHGLRENSMNTAGYVTSIVGLVAGILTILVTILAIVFSVAAAAGLWQYVIMPEIM